MIGDDRDQRQNLGVRRPTREDGVRGGNGVRGAGGPVANEAGGRDDTVVATAGEVSVLFAANDARGDTKGDDDVQVARQTVETNEGK